MTLTERQQKWFASVRAGLERETGRTIEEWVAIARTCPETRPRARQVWLKAQHGLGINRASYVLSEAFPSDERWDEPQALRERLWSDRAGAEILAAVEAAVSALPEVVTGQRKVYTAFSRKVQFAAVRPQKNGGAILGLAVEPDVAPMLSPAGNEAWSERLKSRIALTAPGGDVDVQVSALLRQAWERS